jgi:hypothetical protein
MTSNENPRISEMFNKEFGDFALLSSDDTLFYMPHPILQYSSKVFAAMLEIGSSSSTTNTPVMIQADSDILKMTLTFIHPGMANPVIKDVKTLAQLLRISKQYEMDGMLEALRLCLLTPSEATGESLIIREPFAALALASAFEFKDIETMALQEVIKGNMAADIGASMDFEIPLAVSQQVIEAREARVCRYMGNILAINNMATHTIVQAPKYSGIELERKRQTWMDSATEAIIRDPTQNRLKELASQAVTMELVTGDTMWKMMERFESTTNV